MFVSTLVSALVLVAQTAGASIVSCNLSIVSGGSIRFTGSGNTIEFPNAGLYDFHVTDSTSPDLAGLLGNIGGTFVVGTITSPYPGMEVASVTTNDGAFGLYDGRSATLTASLDWKSIVVRNGLYGDLNGEGVINLGNIDYSGSNSDLLAIASGTDQTVVLTFQFSPLGKKSLTQLMTDGQNNSTSYSASLSAIAVPEPCSWMIWGAAAVGLFLLSRHGRKTLSA